ncbi:MAG: holin, partial [Clostridia bacterium]|nr:holin [Clostridia bacterium]
EAVTALLTVGASVWAWWKNNSFTKAAQEADKYLEQLREQKASDEGEDLS